MSALSHFSALFPTTAGRPAPGDPAGDLAPLGARRLRVLLDISNKCNLRCRMCHFSYDSVFYRPAEYMTPAQFGAIAAKVFPHARQVVLSAGSEPLTSPHFVEILKIAARYALPELAFLTNAQLLTERLADAVIAHGVTEIDVSIDGATKATYEHIRRGGSFDRLVQNLRYLKARKAELGRGPRVQFNLTLMQSNLGELEAFVDLAEELGVERIGARLMMPFEGLGMESESLHLTPRKADEAFQGFLARLARSSVLLINFPDFFGAQVHAPSAPAPAPDASALTPAPASPIAAPAPKAAEPGLPFGDLDLPAEREVSAADKVLFSGWALDGTGVASVTLERDRWAGDPPGVGRITLGRATFLNGDRSDVAAKYPDAPFNNRAGWTFELDREAAGCAEGDAAIEVFVVATSLAATRAEIGRRTVRFERAGKPFMFCTKPFDSVYIDANGDVNPYADCRPDSPYGNLADARTSFESIWFGAPFMQLRRDIIAQDPPSMCRTCANFINRNVNDQAYFDSRVVEPRLSRPIGRVEERLVTLAAGAPSVEVRGWTLSRAPLQRVEIRQGERVLGVVDFDGSAPTAEVGRSRYRHFRRADSSWRFVLDRAALAGAGDQVDLIAVACAEGQAETPVGELSVLVE